MKKNIYIILVFVLFGSGLSKIIAQVVPDKFINYSIFHDYLLRKKVAENPEVLAKYIIYENNIKELIKQNSQKSIETDTLINGRKIIPVVFHIVHYYGAENISDEQIKDAVRLLNIDYNKLNADTTASDTWPAFSSRRANVGIEYRLAKIDPDGNPTDGIQRHSDIRTNYAYYNINHDYSWNPKKYLNVYSVAFIYPEGVNLPEGAAIGGMSVFPPSNPLTPLFTNGDTLADGVLIRHDGIGSIGTATTLMGQPINALNRTFTHELGHYFNLYHPFQNLTLMFGTIPIIGTDGCSTSGGPFGMVALNNDEVNDTPPVISASQNTSATCFAPGSRNTCNNNVPGYGDEVDMAENYMDYQLGYCTNIFTTGQNARITATMNTDRHELWSLENLIATGVLDTSFHPVSAPKSDFNPDRIRICAGTTVNFTEFSYNGTPTNWEWSFPGGIPSFSTEMDPSVSYDTPGIYSVQLKVSNSAGSDSLLKQDLMYVTNSQISDTGNILEGFETTSLDFNNGWMQDNQDDLNTWEITDSASYAGTKSIRIVNFSNNTAGSTDEFILPAHDMTTIFPLTPVKLKFKLSYAAKKVPGNAIAEMLYGTSTADTVYDRLSVYFSTNCGSSWIQRYTKSGFALTTTGLDSTGFMPTSIDQWREETVLFLPTLNQQHHVLFKFQFKSAGGNNMYIDNIQIGDLSTGISESDVADNLDFSFCPNPMNSSSILSFNLYQTGNVSVNIYDVLGKNISTIADGYFGAGNHSFIVSKKTLTNAGIYFVKIRINEQLIVKRVVVE